MNGPPTASPIDWSSLPESIPCPRCAYNLRELERPRCPECGLEFEWQPVFDAARRRIDSSLFEYQWRGRPVRSFFWTIGRLFKPWRLWRETPMTVRPRPGALLLQLGAVVGICVVVRFVALAGMFLLWGLRNRARYGHDVFYLFRNLHVVSQFEFLAKNQAPDLMVTVLTFMALLLFWQTRKKYRVRPALMFRIAVYSGIFLIVSRTIISSVASLLTPLVVWLSPFGYEVIIVLDQLRSLLPWLMPVWFGYALRKHVQVKHAWRLAGLVAIFMVAVVLFTVVCAALFYDSFSNPVSAAASTLAPMHWLDWR